MRWPAVLAVLAVTSAGCLEFLPGEEGLLRDPGDVSLRAEPTGSDGIYVHLVLEGATLQDVVVQVSHEASGARVVDRMAPLTLVAGGVTTASLGGLPVWYRLSVRVGPGPLESYLDDDGDVDLRKARAMPDLAPPVVVHPVPSGDDVQWMRAAAVPVAAERGWDVRVLDLGEGAVAVAWMVWSDTTLSSLRLATSFDHGRTFSAPHTLSDRIRPEWEGYAWSWVQSGPTSLLVLVNEWDGSLFAATRRPSSTLLQFDVATGEMASAPLGPGVRVPGPSDLEQTPDGRILLLAPGGVPAERSLGALQLWELRPGGHATLVHQFDGAPVSSTGVTVDLGVTGDQAIAAWTVVTPGQWADAPAGVVVSRSADAGRTFGPPWAPPQPPHAWLSTDRAVALAADGSADVVAHGTQPAGPAGGHPGNGTAVILRLPGAGDGGSMQALTSAEDAWLPLWHSYGAFWATGTPWVVVEGFRRMESTSTSEAGGFDWLAATGGPEPAVRLVLADGMYGMDVDDARRLRDRPVLAGSANQGEDAESFVFLATLFEALPPRNQLLHVWRTPDTTAPAPALPP